MYEDMPQRKVGEIFENLLYIQGHPLGFDIAGTKETVTIVYTIDIYRLYQVVFIIQIMRYLVVAGAYLTQKRIFKNNRRKIW